MRRIVVGVDGSDVAVAALRWAVRVATATGARVEAMAVAAPLPLAVPVEAVGGDSGHTLATAQQMLDEAVAALGAGADVVDVSVVEGQPAGVLLGAAEGAELLVLGTHGHGAVESALLGSIGRQVATHAHGPTVLVPQDPGRIERILVGVDGSEEALHALRWAVELARRVGADIEVVTAYQAAAAGIGSPWVPPVVLVAERDMRRAATELLSTMVERAAADDVVVERTVAEGGAVPRLRDRAVDADLLVVGSRGHGGFVGLLLGSVSRGCLTHPTCPVAVVPSH